MILIPFFHSKKVTIVNTEIKWKWNWKKMLLNSQLAIEVLNILFGCSFKVFCHSFFITHPHKPRYYTLIIFSLLTPFIFKCKILTMNKIQFHEWCFYYLFYGIGNNSGISVVFYGCLVYKRGCIRTYINRWTIF